MEEKGYRHILAALDLADEHSQALLQKAVTIATIHRAQLSVIYVDLDLKDLYFDLVEIDRDDAQNDMLLTAQKKLEQLLANVNYPIEQRLLLSGDLSEKINHAIAEFGIDLLVCGHHKDIWSRLVSSAQQLLVRIPCDLLVVPLK